MYICTTWLRIELWTDAYQVRTPTADRESRRGRRQRQARTTALNVKSPANIRKSTAADARAPERSQSTATRLRSPPNVTAYLSFTEKRWKRVLRKTPPSSTTGWRSADPQKSSVLILVAAGANQGAETHGSGAETHGSGAETRGSHQLTLCCG